MEIYLVKGKTICLGDLRTISCPTTSGHKKMGRCCITLHEQSLKPVGPRMMTASGDPSINLMDNVAKFLYEDNREAANKIWIQCVSIPSELDEDDGEGGPKLELRLRGDLLRDFHEAFGKGLRFTVEMTNVTVVKETEEDYDREREHTSVPRQPCIANMFRRLFNKTRRRRNYDFQEQEMLQQLPQQQQQQQPPPLPPPRAPWRQPCKTAKLVTKAMKIVMETGVAAHFKDEIPFPKIWLRHWPTMIEEEDGLVEDIDFMAKVNIIMSIEEDDEDGEDGAMSCHRIPDMNRKLLQEQIKTDLEIVAGNGAVARCYSGFLIVQSEVLKSMLHSHPETEEAKTNRITMVDISEEGLSAFLAYLYFRDLKAAEKSSQTAVELLEAGRKYLITYLEEDMKTLLMKKPKEWFEVDATLALFFFASKLEQHSDLAKKAVKILKSNPAEVKRCPMYRKLFHENPDAGRELSDAFLEFSPTRMYKMINYKKN